MRRSLSPQGIYDYLYYHVSPGPHTVFEDLLRVPAGYCIEFGAGAAGVPVAYWTMRFDELKRQRALGRRLRSPC